MIFDILKILYPGFYTERLNRLQMTRPWPDIPFSQYKDYDSHIRPNLINVMTPDPTEFVPGQPIRNDFLSHESQLAGPPLAIRGSLLAT